MFSTHLICATRKRFHEYWIYKSQLLLVANVNFEHIIHSKYVPTHRFIDLTEETHWKKISKIIGKHKRWVCCVCNVYTIYARKDKKRHWSYKSKIRLHKFNSNNNFIFFSVAFDLHYNFFFYFNWCWSEHTQFR